MKIDFKIKAIAFVLLVFAGLYYVNSQSATATASEQPQESSQQAKQVSEQEIPDAPSFTLQDTDGNNVSLVDYKGKIDLEF